MIRNLYVELIKNPNGFMIFSMVLYKPALIQNPSTEALKSTEALI